MVEEWGGIGCPWLRMNRLLPHKTVGNQTAAKEKREPGAEEAARPCHHHHGQPVVVAIPVTFSCFASAALPNSL